MKSGILLRVVWLRRDLIIVIMAVIIVVLIGSNVYSYIENRKLNESETNISEDSPLPSISNILNPKEQPSPYDWIKEENIHIYSDRVIIDVENPEWAAFADTNSMDPLIDMGVNAIEIVPEKESDIHLGDVVSYESEYADGIIIHRVVEIGKDDKGTYFILKGDNNSMKDPGKVRFSQIKRVLVAVIY